VFCFDLIFVAATTDAIKKVNKHFYILSSGDVKYRKFVGVWKNLVDGELKCSE